VTRFLNHFLLVLVVTLLAANSPLSAQNLALEQALGEFKSESISIPASPVQLAFLSESEPSRRHIERPLSDSEADLHVPSQIRVLVFAPHPDDETLATAGLVQRVLKLGGSVRMVFMTNGDGFLDGVRAEFDIAKPTDHNYIEYGNMRQQEALKAISQLGVGEGDAIFLGFPDGGIDDLWAAHWSSLTPYTSPQTRWNHPAYSNTYTRSVKYSGVDLRAQLVGVMRSFSPDWIVLPDTRDTHPDHAATGAFVLDALRELRESGETPFAETEAFTYLVHYPFYPNGQSWMSLINGPDTGGFLASGPALSTTQWMTLPISSNELEGKRKALACHKTQMEPLQKFLNTFLMHYETFGRLRPSQIMEVPIEVAARFRRPKS
jgi:LmbE family N-acetylglucosaminyl deacetylase